MKQTNIQELETNKHSRTWNKQNKVNGDLKKIKTRINYVSTKKISKWWKWAHPYLWFANKFEFHKPKPLVSLLLLLAYTSTQ